MNEPTQPSTLRHPQKAFRYKKPFRGKTAKIDLEFLLFGPSTYLKFAGMSMRGVFASEGKESLFKSIDRCVRQKKPMTSALQRKLLEQLEKFPEPWSSAVQEMFASLANPDAIPPDSIPPVGAWECFLAGYCTPEEHKRPDVQFMLEIERRSWPVMQLLVRKQLEEARETMLNDPLLKLFFWPEAVEIFRGLKANADPTPLIVSVALEVQLSALACRDLFYCKKPCHSWFSSLLPSTEVRPRPPTARFFDWLKQEMGAHSMSAMLNDERLKNLVGEDKLDASTLKRWSTGQYHPSIKLLEHIAQALYPENTAECARPLAVRNLASHLLNTLGYLAQTLSEQTSKIATEEIRRNCLPWPAMPFNHQSFEEWCQARYPVWLEFHNSRLTANSLRSKPSINHQC